jgi:hypothetical protein
MTFDSTLLDKISEHDRLFFERFPRRRHMVRRAYPGEVEIAYQQSGETVPQLSPDRRWFTFVHKVAFCIRTREHYDGPADAETDLSDGEIMAMLVQIDARHGVDRKKFRRGHM